VAKIIIETCYLPERIYNHFLIIFVQLSESMLQKLIIKNYAIIDHLELMPDKGLNIVTGETGAGKSILLGALSLVLGDRADTSVLINKEEKCIAEAFFDIKDNIAFRAALQTQGFDDDTECIIRREIAPSGKSRAFINDTPVTLGILNELASLLVDLHRQFGHLALKDVDFPIEVVDAVAQNTALCHEYETLFKEYRKTEDQLNEYKTQLAKLQKEADYKQFLLDELVQAALKENEIEHAEQQLKQISHSERIIATLQNSLLSMTEGETPVINEIKRLIQQLQSIADVLPAIIPLSQRMNTVYEEFKDIRSEIEGLENSISFDQDVMLQLQERIDTGYKLLKKHALATTNDLLSLQQKLEQELNITLNIDEQIAVLSKQKEELYHKLVAKAEELSARRKKQALPTSGQVNELLAKVGMPNARFKIAITQQELGPSGIDNITFLFDANKSGQFLPVEKVASGGEMSRIMLCIKSLTAKAMQLPVLVFDEVDTGISGEAAKQVGILLRELASYHQVLCITHQPQVAAKGSKHFYIYKEESKNQKIVTKVRVLQSDERISVIAKMIGGENPSTAAMQNALELVSQ